MIAWLVENGFTYKTLKLFMEIPLWYWHTSSSCIHGKIHKMQFIPTDLKLSLQWYPWGGDNIMHVGFTEGGPEFPLFYKPKMLPARLVYVFFSTTRVPTQKGDLRGQKSPNPHEWIWTFSWPTSSWFCMPSIGWLKMFVKCLTICLTETGFA